jgi:hypothetical protein
MTQSTGGIHLPKPLLIGAGILVLLGLFLASGDPGKEERQQLAQGLATAQDRLNALETQQREHATLIKAQQENEQLLLRRVEVAEETSARLRSRIDEVERQLIAQRKAVVTHPVTKTTTKTPNSPVKAPVNKSGQTAKKPVTTKK